MITTSLRLPKSLLDWVRTQAAAEHVKPTAWIRSLIEQQRANQTSLADRVSVVESAVGAVLEEWLELTRTNRLNVANAMNRADMQPSRTRVRVAGRHHYQPPLPALAFVAKHVDLPHRAPATEQPVKGRSRSSRRSARTIRPRAKR